MPCSAAISTISSIGWMVPTSLLAHITEISDTGWVGHELAQVVEVDPAGRVDADEPDLGLVTVLQPVGRVEHRVVLDRGGDQARDRPELGGAGPVDPLDREVVGLGAARGEHHLARPAVQRLRDRLARLLDHPPRVAPGRVQGARVADLEQVRGHRLDGRGHHRRGGGVVEVDRAGLAPPLGARCMTCQAYGAAPGLTESSARDGAREVVQRPLQGPLRPRAGRRSS